VRSNFISGKNYIPKLQQMTKKNLLSIGFIKAAVYYKLILNWKTPNWRYKSNCVV